ncbi:MAG: hypothetical protein AAF725_22025, partial [Acidobacteriota bacterium]
MTPQTRSNQPPPRLSAGPALLPVLCLLAALAAVPASAQTSFELTPFLGYQFGGTVEEDFDDNDFDFFDDVDVEESESFGVMLGIGVGRYGQV